MLTLMCIVQQSRYAQSIPHIPTPNCCPGRLASCGLCGKSHNSLHYDANSLHYDARDDLADH
eukprot:57271-Pyramimonas_sp.AAC.3